ncbi:UNKNOWN [Stylonychia lemnae]|uniref:Uncharacterized protein n=1 Tax=Stylonychia lemnae TaxID=5949 RepID=A0A077ZVM4_STYLE|nr:UNKNOWN [Stylonychia lemnae]|eukprot:CDW72486.1 UNKNOWN [Stylonychia lemnae]
MTETNKIEKNEIDMNSHSIVLNVHRVFTNNELRNKKVCLDRFAFARPESPKLGQPSIKVHYESFDRVTTEKYKKANNLLGNITPSLISKNHFAKLKKHRFLSPQNSNYVNFQQLAMTFMSQDVKDYQQALDRQTITIKGVMATQSPSLLITPKKMQIEKLRKIEVLKANRNIHNKDDISKKTLERESREDNRQEELQFNEGNQTGKLSDIDQSRASSAITSSKVVKQTAKQQFFYKRGSQKRIVGSVENVGDYSSDFITKNYRKDLNHQYSGQYTNSNGIESSSVTNFLQSYYQSNPYDVKPDEIIGSDGQILDQNMIQNQFTHKYNQQKNRKELQMLLESTQVQSTVEDENYFKFANNLDPTIFQNEFTVKKQSSIMNQSIIETWEQRPSYIKYNPEPLKIPHLYKQQQEYIKIHKENSLNQDSVSQNLQEPSYISNTSQSKRSPNLTPKVHKMKLQESNRHRSPLNVVNVINKPKKKENRLPKEIIDGSNIRVELPNSNIASNSLLREGGEHQSTLIILRENSGGDQQIKDIIEASVGGSPNQRQAQTTYQNIQQKTEEVILQDSYHDISKLKTNYQLNRPHRKGKLPISYMKFHAKNKANETFQKQIKPAIECEFKEQSEITGIVDQSITNKLNGSPDVTYRQTINLNKPSTASNSSPFRKTKRGPHTKQQEFKYYSQNTRGQSQQKQNFNNNSQYLYKSDQSSNQNLNQAKFIENEMDKKLPVSNQQDMVINRRQTHLMRYMNNKGKNSNTNRSVVVKTKDFSFPNPTIKEQSKQQNTNLHYQIMVNQQQKKLKQNNNDLNQYVIPSSFTYQQVQQQELQPQKRPNKSLKLKQNQTQHTQTNILRNSLNKNQVTFNTGTTALLTNKNTPLLINMRSNTGNGMRKQIIDHQESTVSKSSFIVNQLLDDHMIDSVNNEQNYE